MHSRASIDKFGPGNLIVKVREVKVAHKWESEKVLFVVPLLL